MDYKDKNGGMNIFWAVIAGALIGAFAMFFTDDEKKKKLKNKIKEVKESLDEGKGVVKKRIVTELKKAQTKVDNLAS